LAKSEHKERKNGHMSENEFLKLIHTGKLDEYMRRFQVTKDKCPPHNMRDSNIMCYYCLDCFNYCTDQIKETKKEYIINKVKYKKEDFDVKS